MTTITTTLTPPALLEAGDEPCSSSASPGPCRTGPGTGFDVHRMGGAFGRVPQEATPFPRRDARFCLNIYGFWSDPADDDARIAFVRGMSDDMAPFATGGQYVNFEG